MRRAAAGVLAALVCAGCSLLPQRPAAEASAPAPSAPVDANPDVAAYSLVIEAPDDARALLERWLDLARFRDSSGADALTSAELDRLVALAPAQARTLLETEGWFTPTVRARRDGVTVRVTVDPGPRARIDRVTIEPQGELQDAVNAGDADARALVERLLADWKLAPGEPFRQAAWTDAKNALLAALRAAGYAAAQWSGTAARVDTATHGVRLFVVPESGPLFRVGELQIEGLQHHDETVVRRLAGFERGAVASEQRLLDFQERLQGTGLFDGAVVEFDPDPAQAAATPVRVRLREALLQQATVGVGVSANTGPRVLLEHLHRRPFDLNLVAKNKFELGRDRNAWEGSLTTHPLPGQYRNLASGSIERLESADEVRTSWSARLGRTQDTPRIERLYFGELQSAAVKSALGERIGRAASLNYHGVWRAVDSVILPTEGLTLAAQGGAGFARSNFADNGPFGRVYGRLTGYLPLGRAWYGQARIEAGQVFARESVGLPDTLLFRAGGDDSVRGYAYRTLGPEIAGVVTSGRVLFTGSVELARPISERMPSLWGALFVDAGNAAPGWSSIALARGYGAGLRWRSPVGPLRVDLAYGEQIRKWRLHFSVGIAL